VAQSSDRRKTILRAAIEVFARKGYHGCRIADVAREAGVAYGLVYHYFKNKDELLESVFASGWTGFVDRLTAIIDGELSLDEKVRGVVDLSFDAYRIDPRAVKVLLLEIGRSPSGKVNRGVVYVDLVQRVAAMFAAGQQRGELREDAEPLLCATMLFGAIEMGLTAFVLKLLDRKDEEVLERAKGQVAETFLRGVLPSGARATPRKKAI
jgi:TetR/AcrR family fatty acid metabolism transcriptional regulator